MARAWRAGLVALVLAALAGCGPDKRDPQTIEFWTLQLSPTFDDYINGLVRSYEAAHPGVTVRWVDVPYEGITQKFLNAIAAGQAPAATTLRIGGMVERDSVVRLPDGLSVRFVMSDRVRRIPVEYKGILPDLFREGSGVVAEGRLQNGTFVADTILAKHDERYMPPELGNLAAEHKAGKTLEK